MDHIVTRESCNHALIMARVSLAWCRVSAYQFGHVIVVKAYAALTCRASFLALALLWQNFVAR